MLNQTYVKVCLAITYHVSQGLDMKREAQTATGLMMLRDTDGLLRMLKTLEIKP